MTAATSAQAAGGIVDFTGAWTPNSGVGWTVDSEDQDGNCTGTSDAGGYTFTNCHVSGSSYSFDVTCCSGYVSHNTGTISGDDINDGNFHDSTDHAYTAHRTAPGPGVTGTPSPTPSPTVTTTPSPTTSPSGPYPTSLRLICDTPASPNQQGSCTATVGGSGTPTHPYPTGSVAMTAAAGTLYGSACSLTATAGAASAPSCTLPYQPPAQGLPAGTPVPVSARYAGDGTFSSSTAGTRLYGYAADPDSDDPLGVCGDDGSGACDGYDAEVPTAIDELETSLSIAGVCPGAAAPSDRARDDDPQLNACLRNYQMVLTNRDADKLFTSAQQDKIFRNLVQITYAVPNQHTGGDATEARRQSIRESMQALRSLRDGDGALAAQDAAMAIGDLLNSAANDAHDGHLGGELPGGGTTNQRPSAQRAATAAGTRRHHATRLDVEAVLAFVLTSRPSHHDRSSYLKAVHRAYAGQHSRDRVEAREALIVARLLGQYELRRQLAATDGNVRRSLAHRSTKIAAGHLKTVRLGLGRAARLAIKVFALLPQRLDPKLVLTQHRNGHLRTGVVPVHVVRIAADSA